ncbi:HDOD domain-containing protein [bacterium]|nr:HDOD domain-containing protein [bacterium]
MSLNPKFPNTQCLLHRDRAHNILEIIRLINTEASLAKGNPGWEFEYKPKKRKMRQTAAPVVRKGKEWVHLLEQQNDLPVLPEVVFNIDQMIRDENSSIQQIARAVEAEPGLTGRLLKLANSAFFGGGRQTINSVTMAINRLGLNQVREVVYTIQMPETFAEVPALDHFGFWKHSMAVAILARQLARLARLNPEEQELAYISGLLHDIGIIVFSTLDVRAYEAFLLDVKKADNAKPLHLAEINAFQIDHAELGGAFIRKWWKLDDRIAVAVENHHSVFAERAVHPSTAQLVFVANEVTKDEGFHFGIETSSKYSSEDILLSMGLSKAQAHKVIKDLAETIQQIELFLGY